MLYLADEERLSEIDYAESGAVVLGLISLTSHQREVWGTGAAILRCMVEKMEKSRYVLRLLFIFTINLNFI